MLPTRPSIERTSSADSVGCVFLGSGAACWIGFTRSDSLTSILTSCCRVYLALPPVAGAGVGAGLGWAHAVVLTASTPRIASFIFDMAIPFFSGGAVQTGAQAINRSVT